MTRAAPISRRSLLLSVSAAAASITVSGANPLWARSALAAPLARAAGAQFTTATKPVATSMPAVAGLDRGRALTGSARRVVAQSDAESLLVSLNATTKESYWYFADGVVLTAKGLQPWERAVIQDIGPAGRIVTFDAVHADANGTVQTRLTYPDVNAGTGSHRLLVTAANGAIGSAILAVAPWSRYKYDLHVSPNKIDEEVWLDEPVTIRATGFTPGARVSLHLIQSDGTGYQLGANQRLAADKAGVFTYQVQGTSVLVSPGVWEVIVTTDDDGGYGYTTLHVLQPHPPKKIGKFTTARPAITQEALRDTGQPYTMSRMKPFDLVLVTLRTPRGVDTVLGLFRLNGEGRQRNSLSSINIVPTGTYTLLVQSIYTGRWNQVVFDVTDAKGKMPDAITSTLAHQRMTRLEAMDAEHGIVVHAAGFKPGDRVLLLVKDAEYKTLELTPESIDATTVGASGEVRLAVTARTVPHTGRYTVFLRGATQGDPVNLRADLTITR